MHCEWETTEHIGLNQSRASHLLHPLQDQSNPTHELVKECHADSVKHKAIQSITNPQLSITSHNITQMHFTHTVRTNIHSTAMEEWV